MAIESVPPSVRGIEPQERIRAEPDGCSAPLDLVVLSDPTNKHVGLFPEDVLESVEGDPWMFSARDKDDPRQVVFFVAGEAGALVAFGRLAAKAGAVREVHIES